MTAGSTGADHHRQRALIFSRRLSPTSARKRLPVPPRCLGHLPNFDGCHAVEMKVLCEKEVYRVTCTTRTRGKYAKPVLSKGWIEMARKVQLKSGDTVAIFKLPQQQRHGSTAAAYDYEMEIERGVLAEITSTMIEREAAADHHVMMKTNTTDQSTDDDQYYDCCYNPTLLDARGRVASDDDDDYYDDEWERKKMMKVGSEGFGFGGPIKVVKIFGVWVHDHEQQSMNGGHEILPPDDDELLLPSGELVPAAGCSTTEPGLLDLTLTLATYNAA